MLYTLITPIYNESDNISNLIDTVINQTRKPEKWIIVDNGSHDGSSQIVLDTAKRRGIEFIEIIEQKRAQPKGRDTNFSLAINAGFSYLVSKNNFGCDYIGKIDADVLLPNDFFDILLNAMDNGGDIGVMSASSYTSSNVERSHNQASTHPGQLQRDYRVPGEMRDIRLYRYEAAKEFIGLPLAHYSPDTLYLYFLLSSGWKASITDSTYFILIRETKNRGDDIRSFSFIGKMKYYYGHNMVNIIIYIIYNIIWNRNPSSLYTFTGYLEAQAAKEERAPRQILDYVRANKGPLNTLKDIVQKQ